MSSPEYLKAFKALIRSDPNPIHIAQISHEFYVAGARPAAIVQASLIDTILEDLLKKKMRRDLANDITSRMFEVMDHFPVSPIK